MKCLPLLSALLLSASPALANDILYLKCDETRVITSKTTWPDGEEVPLERLDKELFVLKIDAKNKRRIINRTEHEDIVVRGNEAIFSEVYENGNVIFTRKIRTMLSPPYARYGKGKTVVKPPSPPQVIDAVLTANCAKIDSAEFDEFLNQ